MAAVKSRPDLKAEMRERQIGIRERQARVREERELREMLDSGVEILSVTGGDSGFGAA